MIFTIAPLVQEAKTTRRWLITLGIFTGALLLVLALFGAGMAWAGAAVAGRVTTPYAREVIASLALSALGLLALAIALGELGLGPRLLPRATVTPPGGASGSLPRRAIVIAVAFGATMAIFSPLAAYALVIGWIAAQQSVWLGALTLAAYGLGLTVPLAIAGTVTAGRRWILDVGALQERLAIVTAIAMAVTGGFLLSMWTLRATWVLFFS